MAPQKQDDGLMEGLKKAAALWGFFSSIVGTVITLTAAWFIMKGDLALDRQNLISHAEADAVFQKTVNSHIQDASVFFKETNIRLRTIETQIAVIQVQNEIIRKSLNP